MAGATGGLSVGVQSRTGFTAGDSAVQNDGFTAGDFTVGSSGFIGFKLDYADTLTRVVIGIIVLLSAILIYWVRK